MNNKVLVTGAGGFIGSHLTEELVRRGYPVKAMVHYNSSGQWGWLDTLDRSTLDQIEIFPADIRDPHAVSRAVRGCHTVYHLAALIAIPYSYIAPASYISTNVNGTLNVLEACRDYEVSRIVHTSTSETYGSAQYVPIDERHPIVGQSPYSASKIAADKLVESFHLSFDMPVVTIRPFNTFGPRQSARAVIPTIISQALSGAEQISLGSLEPVREFSYVKDTAAGFIAGALADTAVGRTFNIGPGKGVSIGKLAELLLQACDSKARIVCDPQRVRPKNSEVQRLISDNQQALSLLDWQPKFTLTQGIEETVAWMRNNLHRYKPAIYNV